MKEARAARGSAQDVPNALSAVVCQQGYDAQWADATDRVVFNHSYYMLKLVEQQRLRIVGNAKYAREEATLRGPHCPKHR